MATPIGSKSTSSSTSKARRSTGTTRASGKPGTKTSAGKAPSDKVKLSGDKTAPGKSPIDFSQNFGSKLDLKQGQSLRRGAEGAKVEQLQKMLNAKGGQLDVDGKFGPKTERALREYQEKQQIEADGVVGKETMGKLNAQGGAAPGPSPVEAVKPLGATGPVEPTKGAPGDFGTSMDKASQGRREDLGAKRTLQDARSDGNSHYFKAGAQIDVDGSGPSHGDPHKQYQTSLSLKGGGFPNADKVPYFVLPPDVAKQYGAKIGDLGLIRYGDKTIPAVFADRGPGNKIGELSRFAAQQLGIPASPISGGVNKGVEYQVFPGSGRQHPTAAEITPEALQSRIQALLASQQK
ncbi:peptidoglycan-binding protein [bacterium]|nr:peptidoglycan-binding protein [bacterium]